MFPALIQTFRSLCIRRAGLRAGAGILASVLGTTVLMPAATAQNTSANSIANVLRFCTFSPDGRRTAAHAFELEDAIPTLSNTPRGTLSKVGPGLYRFSVQNPQITLELKMVDSSGNGHCLTYGPALFPGFGAAVADEFVRMQFLRGLTPATPASTMTRRYTSVNLPYALELVSYNAPGFGEIAGLIFSGVQPGMRATKLASASAATPAQTQGLLGNAVVACAQFISPGTNLRAALEAAGMRVDRPSASSDQWLIYFGANNTVQIEAGPGWCEIKSTAVQAGTTAQLVNNYLSARLPGQFTPRNPHEGVCANFGSQNTNGVPLFIEIRNPNVRGRQPCNPAGASEIQFVIPG